MVLEDFEATEGSNRNGAELWPIKLQESKYKYLKIIVLEETGHKQLRKILRQLGTGQNGSVVLDFKNGWPETLAKVALLNAATREISKQFSQNKLIDIEYFYESKPAAETIPLRHLRLWNEKPDTPSLEILLNLTDRPARLVDSPNPCAGVVPP